MIIEKNFPGKSKKKVSASAFASTLNPIPPLFLMPRRILPLQRSIFHEEEEYGGFHQNKMKWIHDFKREKDDTPCTIYTRFTKFARKSRSISKRVN